jgi:hypothetical protein
MAARYLKSLETGVVLPYVQAALLSPGVREMSAEECEEYEASIGKTPVVKKAPKKKAAKVETAVAKGEVVTKDISEGEPTADEVLKALETD